MRKLNPTQRKIVFAFLGVFFLLNLFPPWQTYSNPPNYDIRFSLGFHFFLYPPQSPLGYESYVVINYTTLFIEWGLLILMLFLGLRLSNRK